MIDYTTTVKKAKEIKKGVETEFKLVASTPVYYIAKAILKPKTSIKKIKVDKAEKSDGDYFSRQIYHSTYMDMAERLVGYVERNHKMPNNITFTTKTGKKYHINIDLCTEMFARILIYYDTNKAYPKYANITSKAFVKPTETGNTVFDYWVKKFGFKPTCIDDVCDYILNHFDYEFYFDDHKTNKEVIDTQAGNCTDLSQMLSNMADALGYEWKCIHTQCRQSGTGHVYLKLRKGGEWFVRDVACIADESRYCIWCDVDNGGGYLLSENPSWWLQNRQR